LEDVLGDKFQPLKFNGSWLKNNQLLISTDGNDNLQILDAPSGTLQPLLYNESIVIQTKLLLTFRINGTNIFVLVLIAQFYHQQPVPPGSTYSLSPDNRFLLLTTDYRKVGWPI
jgi:hypothetical protein